MNQPTFADLDYESKKRKTRREKFRASLGRLVLTKQSGGYAFDRVQCVSRCTRRAQEERIYLGARVGGHTPEQLVHRDSERVSELYERFKRRHALSRLEVRNRGWRHASALTEGNLG